MRRISDDRNSIANNTFKDDYGAHHYSTTSMQLTDTHPSFQSKISLQADNDLQFDSQVKNTQHCTSALNHNLQESERSHYSALLRQSNVMQQQSDPISSSRVKRSSNNNVYPEGMVTNGLPLLGTYTYNNFDASQGQVHATRATSAGNNLQQYGGIGIPNVYNISVPGLLPSSSTMLQSSQALGSSDTRATYSSNNLSCDQVNATSRPPMQNVDSLVQSALPVQHQHTNHLTGLGSRMHELLHDPISMMRLLTPSNNNVYPEGMITNGLPLPGMYPNFHASRGQVHETRATLAGNNLQQYGGIGIPNAYNISVPGLLPSSSTMLQSSQALGSSDNRATHINNNLSCDQVNATSRPPMQNVDSLVQSALPVQHQHKNEDQSKDGF